MLLRELFVREAEPGISNDELRRTGSGYMQSSSGWAGELFGDVNQAMNKPWELADPDSGGTNMSPGDVAGAAAADSEPAGPGSISSAGVSASSDLLTMIKGFEGYHEKVNPNQGARSNVRPYWDVRQWSIGYGSYAGSRDRSRRPNLEWTPQQAEAELSRQLQPYRRNVQTINRRGGYQWTQAQLDALTSFAYNLGSINELTQNGTRSNREIAAKMLEYVNAGGQRSPGLVTRRRIERQKFLQGMAQGRLDYTPGRATS